MQHMREPLSANVPQSEQESLPIYEPLPTQELFQIGEVSKLFHISISILRHYDKIGLLQPEYKDPDTGYRYYSTRQFECLNTIRYLRALDVPLDEIAVFVKNRNIQQIQSMLEKQRENVRIRQKELARIERKIENRLNQLLDAQSSRLDIITVEKKPARRLALLKKDLLPRSYLDLEHSIRELEQNEETAVTFLGKVGIGISRERLEAQVYRPYEIVFILLDEEDCFRGKTITLPEETCVMIRFQGGHEQAEGYYEKLIQYIREQGYRISGFSKEITMIDYGITDDVSQFVTEIQIPVEQADAKIEIVNN
ncbi:MAG: MerR family transcriptional regulator [Lachnospiraceae bacterium]|nr:MerR family transcriptional regulator [Lachnospiraceae bacterium]